METLTSFNPSAYTQWVGILTIVCLIGTILAFFLGWGFRFRLVGVTGFMAVLTVGLFGLGLGLFTHISVPGAVRFARVYDNGANQVVISVAPSITQPEVEATLKQAAIDYFSYGRTGIGEDNQLTIRARTIIHPEPGLSVPLYLGQAKRSLGVRNTDNIQVKIFPQSLAKLKSSTSVGKKDS